MDVEDIETPSGPYRNRTCGLRFRNQVGASEDGDAPRQGDAGEGKERQNAPQPAPQQPISADDGNRNACSPSLRFDGPAFEPEVDGERLTKQSERVRLLMADQRWRTVAEISAITGDPQPSVSAQLRHLRKERFGSHQVERRRRGEPSAGLWEYQVRPPVEGAVRPFKARLGELVRLLREENARLSARVAELEAAR